jgi:hypothetical protein
MRALGHQEAKRGRFTPPQSCRRILTAPKPTLVDGSGRPEAGVAPIPEVDRKVILSAIDIERLKQ